VQLEFFVISIMSQASQETTPGSESMRSGTPEFDAPGSQNMGDGGEDSGEESSTEERVARLHEWRDEQESQIGTQEFDVMLAECSRKRPTDSQMDDGTPTPEPKKARLDEDPPSMPKEVGKDAYQKAIDQSWWKEPDSEKRDSMKFQQVLSILDRNVHQAQFNNKGELFVVSAEGEWVKTAIKRPRLLAPDYWRRTVCGRDGTVGQRF
jgi:hypothetical protein